MPDGGVIKRGVDQCPASTTCARPMMTVSAASWGTDAERVQFLAAFGGPHDGANRRDARVDEADAAKEVAHRQRGEHEEFC